MPVTSRVGTPSLTPSPSTRRASLRPCRCPTCHTLEVTTQSCAHFQAIDLTVEGEEATSGYMAGTTRPPIYCSMARTTQRAVELLQYAERSASLIGTLVGRSASVCPLSRTVTTVSGTGEGFCLAPVSSQSPMNGSIRRSISDWSTHRTARWLRHALAFHSTDMTCPLHPVHFGHHFSEHHHPPSFRVHGLTLFSTNPAICEAC